MAKRGAKGKSEYWLTNEGLLLIEGWARDGLSDEQIAHNMGIAYSTFRIWKEKYPAISATLKKSKEVVDREVENALYKNATGYTYIEQVVSTKKTVKKDGNKMIETSEPVVVEVERRKPPETTAQIFWLKNRKKEQWRDKPEENAKDGSNIAKDIQVLADIISKPAPNRDIEDYE